MEKTNKNHKKGQEEIVGFALIIIIVAVIMLIFVSFAIRNKDKGKTVESYKVESFIQAFLPYTTDCRNEHGFLSIKEIIPSCEREDDCLDNRKSCDVLESNLKEIVKESWEVKEGSSIVGYEIIVYSESKEILNVKEGNITNIYQAATQNLSDLYVGLKVYS
ncbi:MAG: hypothetical protein KKA64_04880 [Nanoarchaeota archaeon]|nr:hypothetical protein [Nanoarchaeota archaeon]